MKKTTVTQQYKHVTLEDVRNLKGYENISDERAENLLNTIQQYAKLLASFHSKKD